MARPREFNSNEVLDKAIAVFWHKGYAATSVQDLVDATGLNRGSLYGSFGDKAELFASAIERYMSGNRISKFFTQDDDRPIYDILCDLFEFLVETALSDEQHRGCLMTNSVTELAPHNPQIARVIADNITDLEDVITARLDLAAQHGEVLNGTSSRALARYLVSSINGFRVMSKINPREKVLRDIAATIITSISNN